MSSESPALAWEDGDVSPSPRRPVHRPAKPPRPAVADVFAALAGIGLGVTIALVVDSESSGALSAPGGALIAVGRLAGFVGAYLLLVMVLLVGRIPWLERAVGQGRLVRLHRRIAPWALVIIGVHVVTITLGYAESSRVGALRQLWTFVTSYPWMLAAIAGFLLLVMAGVVSVRAIRRRVKYETWWAVHLYTYLGLALAFGHQIATGASFVGHPLTRLYWIAVWLGTAGVVLVWRVLLPLGRSLRHQLRVVSVLEESPGVFSVVCAGRRVERLAVSGGQFLMWRFIAKDLWWHAHPFSLSALPHPPYLRVTVKAVGDQSAAIARLRPGTRVFIEGPYGTFTGRARTSTGVALIGAGVGVTPLRALLEEFPPSVDVSMVVRTSGSDDFVHGRELVEMVGDRGGRLQHLPGSRLSVRLDPTSLHTLVPDISERDVFICGPKGFSRDVARAAAELGVPADRIHQEEFAF
jgi:predicted ferric reductase